MRFLVAVMLFLVGGCGGDGLSVREECELSQSAPTVLHGSGTECVSPLVDGVHAEVTVGGYSVLVTSLDGFAPGSHQGVMVDQLGSSDAHWPSGIALVTVDEHGWFLAVRAVGTAGTLAATLSGR